MIGYSWFIYIKTKIFQWKDSAYIAMRYPSFFYTECWFFLLYLFCNPYRVCKKHQQVYGETPLKVLEMCSRYIPIYPKRVLEVGSGRGKGCFFLAFLFRCSVVGCEYIQTFIAKARVIRRWHSWLDVCFIEDDWKNISFSGVDLIYLYGTLFSKEDIICFMQKVKKSAPAAIIISVSYPLCDYDSFFSTQHIVSAHFPWGKTMVYINQGKIS